MSSKSKRRRRYSADYILDEESTGIGIVEYIEKRDKKEYTVAIQSIYINRKYSHSDAQREILKIIRYKLDDDEKAKARFASISARNMMIYSDKVRARYVPSEAGANYQAYLLAEDAIRRRSTIRESFDEPIYFSIIEQEKDELKQDE